MRYPQVKLAVFQTRPNRFIANCQLDDQPVVAHVKNTGKCRELLLPGATVALTYCPGPQRKTDYDLIAVLHAGRWINLDSQIPNDLAAAGVRRGLITLPGMAPVAVVRREVVFQDSRLDLAGTSRDNEAFFVEVKGVTLLNGELAAFPDAVTTRGLKHVHTLMAAQRAGYQAYLLFIVQAAGITTMTINRRLQPELATAIAAAQAIGVQVLVYGCQVTADSIEVAEPLRFSLDADFVLPE
ncbi:DNA/RNA nuclease SfsA [Lapidilactobacillus salsurivasis]